MAISGPHNVRDLYRDTTGQFQTSAESQEFTTCTSSTRPASPNTGNMIFETDTGQIRVWDGAAWDQIRQTTDTVANTLVSGTILQAQQRMDSTQQYATGDYATVVYCYITPIEANSRILIFANMHVHYGSAGDHGYGFGIYSSQVGGNLAGTTRLGAAYDGRGGWSSNAHYSTYMHTGRNSTAYQYYQIYMYPYLNNSGTGAYVNRNYQGTDNSWMTLLEIKA